MNNPDVGELETIFELKYSFDADPGLSMEKFRIRVPGWKSSDPG
jgi:hypothetical protein